eukprot:Nk52_evm100s208 gene=Nk52_evmTU100s208
MFALKGINDSNFTEEEAHLFASSILSRHMDGLRMNDYFLSLRKDELETFLVRRSQVKYGNKIDQYCRLMFQFKIKPPTAEEINMMSYNLQQLYKTCAGELCAQYLQSRGADERLFDFGMRTNNWSMPSEQRIRTVVRRLREYFGHDQQHRWFEVEFVRDVIRDSSPYNNYYEAFQCLEQWLRDICEGRRGRDGKVLQGVEQRDLSYTKSRCDFCNMDHCSVFVLASSGYLSFHKSVPYKEEVLLFRRSTARSLRTMQTQEKDETGIFWPQRHARFERYRQYGTQFMTRYRVPLVSCEALVVRLLYMGWPLTGFQQNDNC